MANIKDMFNDLVENVNNLRISKKSKEQILDLVCDILLQLEDDILSKQNYLEDRLDKIEQYINDDIEYNQIDYDLSIKCPYCNREIDVFMDKDKMDIKCPLCNNIIELEWDYNQKNKQDGTK